MAAIEVAQEAPDFTLRDENNQSVRLGDQRGSPVVLVFYPADFSPVCSDEMCAYRDDYSQFQAKGARVFGISRDSVWAHKAFKDSLGLTHTLLSDPKGEVARLYGTWNEDLALAERLTVVVDGDGAIRYLTRSELLKPRDHREALAALG
jgi:peroxiredoxin (alkyl hydroperoxide reductase subunit C)